MTDQTTHQEPSTPPSDLPIRVVVGANGAYWREYGDMYSMCPVSTDNDPIEIVAVYVRDHIATLLRNEARLGKWEARATRLDAPEPLSVLTTWLHRHDGHDIYFVSEHTEGSDLLSCYDCDHFPDSDADLDMSWLHEVLRFPSDSYPLEESEATP